MRGLAKMMLWLLARSKMTWKPRSSLTFLTALYTSSWMGLMSDWRFLNSSPWGPKYLYCSCCASFSFSVISASFFFFLVVG